MELRKFWEIFWRRKILFLLIILIITGTPVVLTYFLAPMYKAGARVAIDLKDFQPDYLSNLPRSLGSFTYIQEKNVVDTFKELLRNPISLYKLIRQLDLRDTNGELLKSEDLLLSMTKYPKFLIGTKKALTVKQIASAEMFAITGYSDDPEEAVRIANTAVEIFLDLYSDLYRQKSRDALKAMQDMLPHVKSKLLEAEQKVVELKAEEEMIDIDEQTKVLVQQITNLEAVFGQNERDKKEQYSALNYIEDSFSKVPDIYKKSILSQSNSVIEDYKSQLLLLESSLVRLLTELTPEHYEVKAIQNQIDSVKKAIKQEILASETEISNPYYRNLLNRYCEVQIELNVLDVGAKVISEQVKMKKAELKGIPRKIKLIRENEREALILQGQYNSLKEGINSAKISLEMKIGNARIINFADISYIDTESPYFPNRKKIAVLALFLGMSVAFFAIFLLEYVNNSLWNVDDAERDLDMQVLAEIPRAYNASRFINDNISDFPDNKRCLFWDAFWNLKGSIRLASNGTWPQVLTVTSLNKNDGKSIVSYLMAKVLAESGMKVLLVDNNFRRPYLKKFIEIDPSNDLNQFLNLSLQDGLPLEDYCKNIGGCAINNLYLIPTSKHPYPLQLVDSPNMEAFILYLKENRYYDIVILDTSALNDGKESYLLSRFSDKTIVVLRAGNTDISEATKAIKDLNTPSKKVIGTVFNHGKRIFF